MTENASSENLEVENTENNATDDVEYSNEIIDATQNAIIDAAENVSEVLSPAVEVVPEKHEEVIPFYMDVEFWVGLVFIVTAILVFKPLMKFVKKFFTLRIETIINEISEAQKVLTDAQVLLAKYERQTLNQDKEVKEIIENAKKNISNYKQEQLKELKSRTEKKQEEFDALISNSTAKLQKEILTMITDNSVKIVKNYIQYSASKEDHEKIIDNAIEELE